MISLNAQTLPVKSCWALVPVKCFALAKQRLAPLFDNAVSPIHCSRAAFAAAMLADLLEALQASKNIHGVLLVTGETSLESHIPASFNKQLLIESETGIGLNSSVSQGIATLQARGVEQCVVLPADIPLCSGESIDAVIEQHRLFAAASEAPGISVLEAASAGGTNALIFSPDNKFQPAFGEGSFKRHIENAQNAGFSTLSLSADKLALDIDQPEQVV